MDGDGNYVYSNYDIYNAEGQRLNSQSYANIDGHFGRAGLLLVTDFNGHAFYINREAKKLDVDLSGYDDIKAFSNGLAAVKGSNNKYGYIDLHGTLVIPLMYDRAGGFSGGTALVKGDDAYFLITPNNKLVAIFTGDLQSSSSGNDSETASYTFLAPNTQDSDVYTTYDHTGAIVSQWTQTGAVHEQSDDSIEVVSGDLDNQRYGGIKQEYVINGCKVTIYKDGPVKMVDEKTDQPCDAPIPYKHQF